jgi:hypothetical protein
MSMWKIVENSSISTPNYYSFFLGAFEKLSKATLTFVMSVRICLSTSPSILCPSAWNLAPTRGIFIKFDIWGVFPVKKTCRITHTAVIAACVLLPCSAQLQSLNILALSTYDFHLLRSWMQLIQFFIFSCFISFLMSSSHLFFGLPCGRIDIGFHLYTFLYHSLFWHSM